MGFRLGCLLFAPFLTLVAWMIQGLIWLMAATPILAYALLMGVLGGGLRR